MTSIKVLVIIAFLAAACSGWPGDNVRHDFKEIVGCWQLVDPANEVNYPKICFERDSSAIFSSRGDTLYAFKLKAVDTHLHLADVFGEVFSFPIHYLGKDSLVFKDIMTGGGVLIYKRM